MTSYNHIKLYICDQLYPYKTVKYESYALGTYFQMALLRQRTAQGSNAAEIEKKIKR